MSYSHKGQAKGYVEGQGQDESKHQGLGHGPYHSDKVS